MRPILATLLVLSLLISCVLTPLAEKIDPLSTATLMSDANGNGVPNAGDALAVLRYSVGKGSAIEQTANGGLLADVDGNGWLEVADALEILQYSVALRSDFSYRNVTPPFFTVCTPNTDWWSDLEGKMNTAYLPHPGFSRLKESVYAPVYWEYGFASAPGMLAYLEAYVQNNGQSLGAYQWVALLPICFNLQIDTQGCLKAFANTPANPDVYTWEALLSQFKGFVGSVPSQVTSICENNDLTYEEQLVSLSQYGILALPFLAQRIEAGEVQWKACFENQLLGVPHKQRMKVLASCYAADIGWADASPTDLTWQQKVFDTKRAAGLPVDTMGWIQSHREELTTLKNWCLELQETE